MDAATLDAKIKKDTQGLQQKRKEREEKQRELQQLENDIRAMETQLAQDQRTVEGMLATLKAAQR